MGERARGAVPLAARCVLTVNSIVIAIKRYYSSSHRFGMVSLVVMSPAFRPLVPPMPNDKLRQPSLCPRPHHLC